MTGMGPRGENFLPIPPMRAGLRCFCPRCGQGALYDGLLRVAASCAECGLDLTPHESAAAPAVFANFILGFVVVPAAFEARLSANHLQYAITWYALAVVLAVIYVLLVRGRRKRQ